jgi:putative endopeptidase
MLRLANLSEAEAVPASARKILGLERRSLRSATAVDKPGRLKGNNRGSGPRSRARRRDSSWAAYFTAAGLADQEEITVWQPRVTGTPGLVGREPLAVWKDYLAFRAISRAAPYPPRSLSTNRFCSTAVWPAPSSCASGGRRDRVRRRRSGMAVGKLYVEVLPPRPRRRPTRWSEHVAALGHRIDRLSG